MSVKVGANFSPNKEQISIFQYINLICEKSFVQEKYVYIFGIFMLYMVYRAHYIPRKCLIV